MAQQQPVPGSPAEVTVGPGSHEYWRYRIEDALAPPYAVPPVFLRGIRAEASHPPAAPLIVFINARSGGRDGPNLARALSRAVGRVQVFDLSEHKPDKVLGGLWANLQAQEAEGNPMASLVRQRLRILVAGGDGTIAWVLGCIKTLSLKPAPPVAIMPLGTGNDLSRSFGWGHAFSPAWIKGHSSAFQSLLRVATAPVTDLDCWRVRITLPNPALLRSIPHSLAVSQAATLPQSDPTSPSSEPIAEATTYPAGAGQPCNSSAASQVKSDAAQPLGEAVNRAGPSPLGNPMQASQGTMRAQGLFWNYLSVGLDAKAAHGFHSLREHRPYLTRGRLINQAWYSVFSCTTGWFCCTKPLSSRVALSIQTPGDPTWRPVTLADDVKALVLLNLQSYAGGRNLWGTEAEKEGSGLKEPSFHDGLVEVVGLINGYHTAAVMATLGKVCHARRLCQASGVRMELRAKHVRPDGSPSHAYMQVDGEPWVQDVPSSKDAAPITVEVTHCGTSKLLHNRQPLTSRGRGAHAATQQLASTQSGIQQHLAAAAAGRPAAPPPGLPGSAADGKLPGDAAVAAVHAQDPNPISPVPSNAAAYPLHHLSPSAYGRQDSEAVHVGSERLSSDAALSMSSNITGGHHP